MRDLTVEIPKKYRKELSKRFSISNFIYDPWTGEYETYISCILCDKYNGCKECPFDKLKSRNSPGCLYWIRRIAGNKFTHRLLIGTYTMKFNKKDRDFIKSTLKELKVGAKRYIKWV